MNSAMNELKKYLDSLLHHGWEESWIDDLTLEQVVAIAALSNRALLELVGEAMR